MVVVSKLIFTQTKIHLIPKQIITKKKEKNIKYILLKLESISIQV